MDKNRFFCPYQIFFVILQTKNTNNSYEQFANKYDVFAWLIAKDGL